ncbi:MAG: polysaccharide biosynthesis tyrosine autokinase [Blastocatellia bacterium]|nr:polysaccharide biosynthesis tyrosine autokinase [Blastocatellia bacterium]
MSKSDSLAVKPVTEVTPTPFRLEKKYRGGAPVSVEEKEHVLRKYLQILLKYKWSILACIAVVMVVVTLALGRVQPIYEATSTIQVNPEELKAFDARALILNPNRVDPEYLNTQLLLFSNPTLAQRVVKKLNLNETPEFLESGPTTLSAALTDLLTLKPARLKTTSSKLNPATKAPKIRDLKETADDTLNLDEELAPFTGVILNGMQTVPLTKTRLVRVTFRHHDPEMAQKVVNAMTDTFVTDNLQRRVSSSQSTSKFLQKRITELQTDIQKADEDLVDYGKNHEIISLSPDQNAVTERLQALSKKLFEIENNRKDLESNYRLAKETSNLSALPPELRISDNTKLLEEQLNGLRKRRNELIVEYTENWPEVKQVDFSIQQVEKQIRLENDKTREVIETKYRLALAREKTAREDYNNQMALTLKQNQDAINYKLKQQELEIKKDLLKTLLSSLKNVDISASSEVNNISVTGYAPVPRTPISPNRRQTFAVTFFLAVLASFGLAYARESWSNRIHSVEDVDRFVKLPTLGLIPSARPKAWALQNGAKGEGGGPGELAANREQLELITFQSATSSIAESYRQLRTSMLLSRNGDRRLQVILVTSSQPSEGKTTTAANIAISLAQTGSKTVLVDCDLRKPRAHSIFNLKADRGIADFLNNEADFDSISYPGPVPNFEVIPCGTIPANPADLLSMDRLKHLVGLLREQFTHVVIDSPPSLLFADAVILSAVADGVLLVVNSETSKREVVMRTCRSLEEANANLLGVVLNNVSFEQGGGYGYGYQKYRAEYYSNEAAPTGSWLNRALGAFKESSKGNRNQDKK